jgi:polar amino acid transport system substrate-binding protein
LKKFLGSPEHLALVEPFGFGKDFLPTKTTAELCASE